MPALLLPLLLALSCADKTTAELDSARSRIATLEQEVARLNNLTARLESAPTQPAKPEKPPLQLDTPFTATCPGGWTELGAIGNTKWSCRSPERDEAGSWPQCHVLSLRYEAAWQPREYFELARSLAPQLRTTHAPEITPLVVETHPGFLASYETRSSTTAQKALASLLVEGDSAYVTSCWTSAASFAELEPTFRRVVESVRFKPK